MGIQDNERRRIGLHAPVRATSSLTGTGTELRIARVQRDPAPAPIQPPQPGNGAAGRLPRIDSRSLFGTGREVVITHDGADYRLRVTASGKLILTK
jgi:hemin uptake protein HemP